MPEPAKDAAPAFKPWNLALARTIIDAAEPAQHALLPLLHELQATFGVADPRDRRDDRLSVARAEVQFRSQFTARRLQRVQGREQQVATFVAAPTATPDDALGLDDQRSVGDGNDGVDGGDLRHRRQVGGDVQIGHGVGSATGSRRSTRMAAALNSDVPERRSQRCC